MQSRTCQSQITCEKGRLLLERNKKRFDRRVCRPAPYDVLVHCVRSIRAYSSAKLLYECEALGVGKGRGRLLN